MYPTLSILASVLATAFLLGARALGQTSAPYSNNTATISGGGNGLVEVIEWLYPQTPTMRVNYNDVLVFNWWANVTGGAAEFLLLGPTNVPSVALLAYSTSVSQVGTTAYTFPSHLSSFTSYPYTAVFGLGVSASAGAFTNDVSVVVTSTSGLPTTYASATTGTAVALPTESAASNSAAGTIRDKAWVENFGVAVAIGVVVGMEVMW